MSPAALPNLHDALLLHRQGRLAEAAQGYQNVLRADPANAQPTLKALVDGCTDAGIWVDDDSTHLIGPDPRRGCNLPGLRPGEHRVVLIITPGCN